MWHAHDGMGWWMMFGGGMWLLFIVLLVALAVLYIRPTMSGSPERGREDSAEEIARRRFARGEISREEYEQLRQDLLRDVSG